MHLMPDGRLSRDGKRLILASGAVVPPARMREVTEAQLAAAEVTRVYDLESGQLTGEPSPLRSATALYRRLGTNVGLLIDARGIFVAAYPQRRSGRIVVVDASTGTELQRIESVGQAASEVSPDARWLIMRKRDSVTLRFFRVQE
jgi:hypothetical protein